MGDVIVIFISFSFFFFLILDKFLDRQHASMCWCLVIFHLYLHKVTSHLANGAPSSFFPPHFPPSLENFKFSSFSLYSTFSSPLNFLVLVNYPLQVFEFNHHSFKSPRTCAYSQLSQCTHTPLSLYVLSHICIKAFQTVHMLTQRLYAVKYQIRLLFFGLSLFLFTPCSSFQSRRPVFVSCCLNFHSSTLSMPFFKMKMSDV